MNQLIINNLRIGYGGKALGEPLSLELPAGSRCGIIGPNGSGKSTLLKTLLHLQQPISGDISWWPDACFGYVPQHSHIDPLFPLTVDDYLDMGCLGPQSAQIDNQLLQTIVERLDIESLRQRLVRDLSGGERQRVLLARAMEQVPDVLAFDEAWSALDVVFQEKVFSLLKELLPEERLTLFIVEHDLNRVAPLVDWLVLMGSEKIITGPKDAVLTKERLQEAFGAELPKIES